MHRFLRTISVAVSVAIPLALVACDPGGEPASTDDAPDAAATAAPAAARPHLRASPGMKLLIIEKKGTGQGIVRGPDFECDAACPYLEVEYPLDSHVALTAEPAAADDHFSRFASWAVDCTGVDPAVCNLTFDRSRKVEATFDLDGQLLVNRIGVAGGRVTSKLADGSPGGIDCGSQCNASYGAPTALTLTAAPVITTTGAVKLLRWGGACFGSQETCTLDLAGTHVEVNAEFRNTLTILPQGNGTATFKVVKRNDGDPDEYVIDCGSDCEGMYSASDVVTVTAVPAPGSEPPVWGDQCTPVPNNPLACKVTMDAPRTLRPLVRTQQSIRITGIPAGTGTILATRSNGLTTTCAPVQGTPSCMITGIPYGTALKLKASPDSSHVFESWAGCSPTTSAECSLVVTQFRDVSVTFATRYQVRASILGAHPADATLTVIGQSPACHGACTYKFPQPQTVTIEQYGINPWQECWVFDRWGEACSSAGAAKKCTLNVNDVKNVTAKWKRLSSCSPPHH